MADSQVGAKSFEDSGPRKADSDLSYHSYLLRFWRDGAETSWRAMLEEPHTGHSHHFPSIEQLYEFLNERMRGQDGQKDSNEPEGGLHVPGANVS